MSLAPNPRNQPKKENPLLRNDPVSITHQQTPGNGKESRQRRIDEMERRHPLLYPLPNPDISDGGPNLSPNSQSVGIEKSSQKGEDQNTELGSMNPSLLH